MRSRPAPTPRITVRRSLAVAAGFLTVAALAAAVPASAQEACVPVPFENDRCPEWTAVYDNPTAGPTIGVDEPAAIAVAPDGARVFVAGASNDDETGGDMVTIAYGAGGQRLWTARYHQPALGTEGASDIAVSPDGATVIVAGAEDVMQDGDGRATIAAYDAETGEERWVVTHDGPAPGNDGARAVVVSPDGDTVYAAISSRGPGDSDILTVAFDAASGEERWSHRRVGAGPADVALSSDGTRLFVTGAEGTGPGASAFLTIAYELAGPEPPSGPLWTASYAGQAGASDAATAIDIGGDGSVFVTGTVHGTSTDQDWATVSYDADTGEQRWDVREATDGQDRPAGLVVAGDRVVVTGKTIGEAARVGDVFVRQPGPLTAGYAAADGTRAWKRSGATAGHFGEDPRAIAASADGSRVFVTDQSGVLTEGAQGGCSSGEFMVCNWAVDPGRITLTALAAEDGRQEWTAVAPGPGNLYRPSAVPVAVLGSRVYVAATFANQFAISGTGVQPAGNFTDLWTMAYRIPTEDPGNVACSIEPFNPVDGSTGAGFGTPQVRHEDGVERATDNGTFEAGCHSGDGAPFVITARYRFEVSPAPGEWESIGPAFACSSSSVAAGAGQTSAIAVPGTPRCDDASVELSVDDATLGFPHRMCVNVLGVSGCSAPWTHEEAG